MSKKITRGNSEEFRDNWGKIWGKKIVHPKQIYGTAKLSWPDEMYMKKREAIRSCVGEIRNDPIDGVGWI